MSNKRKQHKQSRQRELLVKIIAIILLAATLLGTILPSIITFVSAATSDEIKEQIGNIEQEQKDLEDRIEELEKEKIENATEIEELMAQKAILDQQASALYEQIQLVDQKIAAHALLIADKQEEFDEANERLLTLRAENKERIRTMEESGAISYWAVLFKASSFADFLDRLNMIEEIANADRRRIEALNDAAIEVANAKLALEAEKEEMDEYRDELAVLEVEMKEKQQAAEELMRELVAKGEEFEKYIHQAENDLLKLEEELLAAEKAYDEAKKQEYLDYINSLKNGPGEVKIDQNGIPWVVPCYYTRLSSPFGYRMHPVHKEWRMHNGVDLAGDCPTPIWATRGGVVTVSGWSDSAGYYVKIDHLDGYSSVYMHLCKMPNVRVGDVVIAGDKIGCMGTTGTSTGVHLHFGIQYNGAYVDPMRYIG